MAVRMGAGLRQYHCPQCGYNLRGQTVERCPECDFHYDLSALRELAWQAFMGACAPLMRAAKVLALAAILDAFPEKRAPVGESESNLGGGPLCVRADFEHPRGLIAVGGSHQHADAAGFRGVEAVDAFTLVVVPHLGHGCV